MDFSIISIFVFVSGFILVIDGGSMLVEACNELGKKLNVSPLVMGAGVLSLITTMPEIMVGIYATSAADYTLAIGNSVGSMICNFGLVLGVSFLFYPSNIQVLEHKRKSVILLLFTLLFSIFVLDCKIIFIEGACLFVGFVVYYFSILKSINSKDVEKVSNRKSELSVSFSLFLFFLGGLAIALGARAIVDNASTVGLFFNIDEKIVGLVVVAIGTSLPELVTAVCSAKNGYAEMGIGNMIGANMVNCSLILGVSSFVAKGKALLVPSGIAYVGILFLCIISAITIMPLLFKGRSYKWQGILLLTVYVFYILSLFIVT